MRILRFLSLTILCILLLCSCASISDMPVSKEGLDLPPEDLNERIEPIMNHQSNFTSGATTFETERRVENTTPLSKILTTEYTFEELQDFFRKASAEKYFLSSSSMLDVRIATANERFPIQCLRQTESGVLYTVYKVAEGGLFYVFWTGVFDNANDATDVIVDWTVDFTAYLPNTIQLTQDDFKSIIPGSTTAEDVASIDPNVELCFLLSSRTASYSLLKDGSVMEICYDFGATVESKADLIVKSKEIVSEANSLSKLASVYPYDLP